MIIIIILIISYIYYKIYINMYLFNIFLNRMKTYYPVSNNQTVVEKTIVQIKR
jgi:hypothetical protein